MRLSKLEMETIVLFNEEEDTVNIYTYNPKLLKKLDILCEKHPESYRKTRSNDYELPKKLLTLILKEPLTAEQQKAISDRNRKHGFQKKIAP